MIEYYTIKHRGGEEEYTDNLFMNYGSTMTIMLLYSSRSEEFAKPHALMIEEAIKNCHGKDFGDLMKEIAKIVPGDLDYFLLQATDDWIKTDRHGKVYAYIVKNGELKLLPNGQFGLEDEDRIVCGTYSFFEKLSDPAILSDASTSISSEEWMDNLICRISEQTMLAGDNLTAVTMIVRSDD
ncbi:MAG: hypothetical protein IJ869_01810 [Clostridiales bacterium]|nr:hypothetical protein [Clostridiales bacterium]HAW16209.1 hypothetical protein [Clostridiales bacterium]